MADGAFILTSEVITSEEFLAFLPEAGAYVLPDDLGFQGQLDKDGSTIWMGIDNTVSAAIATDPELSTERAAVLAKLGIMPHTGIVIEQCDYTLGNTRLTMEFILAFAKRWPCVVQVAGEDADAILTADEVAARYEAGLGLG